MRTAIIYYSKYGTTQKVAEMIQARMVTDTVTMINIQKEQMMDIDLSIYNRIIIGTSVYAGSSKKRFKKFCTDNYLSLFAQKEIGLFLCGMEPDSMKQQAEIEHSFPDELLRHSKARGFMGGEFLMDKMNIVERVIIKKIAKTSISVSAINEQAVNEFVSKMMQ